MNNKNTVAIVGAGDHEMESICSLLKKHNIAIAYALNENGFRVNAKQAYSSTKAIIADSIKNIDSGLIFNAEDWENILFVECTQKDLPRVLVADHHNEGDPGFGKDYNHYWEASSLGQVCNILNEKECSSKRLVAAADHCLTDAYAGRCVGVDPDELFYARAAWKAKYLGITQSEALKLILAAEEVVKNAYCEKENAAIFTDTNSLPKFLPEAAAKLGVPIMYNDFLDGGIVKQMAKGFSEKDIEKLMSKWSSLGYEVYGNPKRGYAGSYIK